MNTLSPKLLAMLCLMAVATPGCMSQRSRDAGYIAGGVMGIVGTALAIDAFTSPATCDSVESCVHDGFARPLVEGGGGLALGVLGVVTLLVAHHSHPTEPRPATHFTVEARAAAAAGDCAAVRTLLDRLDRASRVQLAADPAVAACQ